MSRPDRHLAPFDELVELLGEKQALRLCRAFSGRRIPNIAIILRRRRDEALVADWLNGAQIGELTAKYGVSRSHAKGLITKYCKDHTQHDKESARSTSGVRRLG